MGSIMRNVAVTKWILQRVTAVILLPLLIWFLSVFIGFPVGSPEIPRIFFRGVISDLSDMAALRLCDLVIIGFYRFL